MELASGGESGWPLRRAARVLRPRDKTVVANRAAGAERLAHARARDVVRLEARAERAPGHAEQLRGARLVAVAKRQALNDAFVVEAGFLVELRRRHGHDLRRARRRVGHALH